MSLAGGSRLQMATRLGTLKPNAFGSSTGLRRLSGRSWRLSWRCLAVVTPNTSLERTRERQSAKPKRRRARRSAQPLGGVNHAYAQYRDVCLSVFARIDIPTCAGVDRKMSQWDYGECERRHKSQEVSSVSKARQPG